METDKNASGRGIQDDDLSEGMMQDWEESQLNHYDPQALSKEHQPQGNLPIPVVQSKDNKAKQC